MTQTVGRIEQLTHEKPPLPDIARPETRRAEPLLDLFWRLLKLRLCIGNRWQCDNGHEWVTAHCDAGWFDMPTTCPECGQTATAHRGKWQTLEQWSDAVQAQIEAMKNCQNCKHEEMNTVHCVLCTRAPQWKTADTGKMTDRWEMIEEEP